MAVSRCRFAGIEREVEDGFTAYKVLNGVCAGV
jgi:hypothetical protein